MEKVTVNNVDITELITSFEVYEEMDRDLIIGSAVSTQIKVKLRNRDNLLQDLMDYPFVIGNKTYIVYEKPEKWTQSISVTLYDKMILSNIAYQTGLVYPTTVREQLYEMASLMKVDIDQSTLSDELLNKEVNWYDNTMIIRNYLGFIAQCDGKNAFIENDKIVFRRIAVDTHEEGFCSDYELNELITFTRVCYDDGLNILYKGNETKHTLYLSSNNLYITQNDIDRIYEMYKDFSFYSFKKFKCKENSIHLTDLVKYNDITIMPLSIKRKVYGGEAKDSIELSGDITIKNADSVVVKYDQTTKIRKIQTTVDQNTQTLTIVAEQTEGNTKDISGLKISLDGIETEVSKTSNSIYKFETGHGNIFDDCNQTLQKDISNVGDVSMSNMPLGINKDYMQGKDICISTFIRVTGGIIGSYGNYIGAEFEIGYADGTKKLYSTRWYLGQYSLQYLLQTSTVDHEERIWAHFKIEDKEITSVSNLKMIIAFDCEKAIVANPKVEFGTFPTGFEFDVNYIRDNVETIQKDYTEIKQEVGSLSLQAVSMEEQITTIKGDVNSVTTRIQSAEIKLEPTNILLAVNEKIGIDGQLYTTKFVLDKNGVHISGGGLDISNNSGTKVLYADTSGNLVINNLTANNGTFSGKVTATSGSFTGAINATSGTFKGTVNASTIVGSTISGGSINGTTIATDKDLNVGNNIYLNKAKPGEVKGVYLNSANYIGFNGSSQLLLRSSSYAGLLGGVNTSSQQKYGMIGAESGRASMSYHNGSVYDTFGITTNQIYASRSITVTSDARKKKNITSVDTSWIYSLLIKEFEYLNDSEKMIGLIAQDYIGYEWSKYFLRQSQDGYYAIDYQNVSMALVKEVQKLRNQIIDMQSRIGGTYGIKY